MQKVPPQFFQYVGQIELFYPEEFPYLAFEVYQQLICKLGIDLSKGLDVQIGMMRKCLTTQREQFKSHLVQIHSQLLKNQLNPTLITTMRTEDEKNQTIEFSEKVFLENRKFNREAYMALFRVYESTLKSNLGVSMIVQRHEFSKIMFNLLISYAKNQFCDKYPSSEKKIEEMFLILKSLSVDEIKPIELLKSYLSEQFVFNQTYQNILASIKEQNSGRLYQFKTDQNYVNLGALGFQFLNQFFKLEPMSFEPKLEFLVMLTSFIRQYEPSSELNLLELMKKPDPSDQEYALQEFIKHLKLEKDLKMAFINLSQKLKSFEIQEKINAKEILFELSSTDINSRKSLYLIQQANVLINKLQNSQTKKVEIEPLQLPSFLKPYHQHITNIEVKDSQTTILTIINSKQILVLQSNGQVEFYANQKKFRQFKDAFTEVTGSIIKSQ